MKVLYLHNQMCGDALLHTDYYSETVCSNQCDQIWRFIGHWETF